jgi:hypothetical protein
MSEKFDIKPTLNISPYAECLLDVSNGIPVGISLKNFGLNEAHNFKVDCLEFYYALRAALQFGIRKTYTRLDNIAICQAESSMISTQAKVLIWKAEKQILDDKTLSERIDRLLENIALKEQERLEREALKTIGCDDAPSAESYYAKYGAH